MRDVRIAIASVSLLVLTEHQNATAHQTGAVERPTAKAGGFFVPINARAIPPCDPMLRPSTTYRVAIRENLSTVDGPDRGYTHYGTGQDPNGTDPPPPETPDPGSATEYKNNPFHVDVSRFKDADQEWIRVKFVLKNEKLQFDRVQDATGKMIVGISRDDAEPMTIDWFCQMKDVPPPTPLPKPRPEPQPITINDKNKSVLTFYVNRKRAIPGEGGINLHIISRGAASGPGGKTPIIIDPKVKNDG